MLMIFDENVKIKNLGKKIGFFIGGLLFFSVLYFILSLLNKIPEYISYWYVLGIVIVIGVIYTVLKK